MAFSNYFLKIGSSFINDPSPSVYRLNSMYIDVDSERNANGDLIRNVVNKKYKIELEFASMKASKLKALLTLLDATQLTVQFYDQKTDTYKTSTFYPNDLITSPLFKKVGQEIVYDRFAVNLIEY